MVAAIAEGVGHKYSDSCAEQEFEILFVLLAEATPQRDPLPRVAVAGLHLTVEAERNEGGLALLWQRFAPFALQAYSKEPSQFQPLSGVANGLTECS